MGPWLVSLAIANLGSISILRTSFQTDATGEEGSSSLRPLKKWHLLRHSAVRDTTSLELRVPGVGFGSGVCGFRFEVWCKV